MTEVLILAEGQTEETFLRDVLRPYLHDFGVTISVTLLKTKILANAPDFKGGASHWGQIERDLNNLLKRKKQAVVTTMLDFYGLPKDTPGISSMPTSDCYASVSHVEAEMENSIGNRLLKVYLALHEFEAFIFVNPEIVLELYPDKKSVVEKLKKIAAEHESPEHINLGKETAPSKRIRKILPSYRKVGDGVLLVNELGIDQIAENCKHFHAWVDWMKSQA